MKERRTAPVNHNMPGSITRATFLRCAAIALGTPFVLGLSACGAATTEGSASASVDGFTTIEAGKLTVVSDMAYPSMEAIPEGSSEPEGFEIDLVTAMAEKLGLEVVFLPAQKFDTIVPMIKQGGRADVGASSFTITDERAQEIDFTDAFMDSNQSIVMRAAHAVSDPNELNNASVSIGVQAGTTGEAWVRENLPEAKCVSLDDAIQALTGCQTGLYDAVVADLPVMAYLCQSSYTDLTIAIEIPTGEQYGMVVSKDNPGLTQALNEALAELQADGTYDELYAKWFGA